MTAPLPGPLVDAGWLSGALAGGHGGVSVVDVRWYLDGRSGRAAYEAGHIPSAVWVDVDTDLSAPPSPGAGRHPLPSPADFTVALARRGIGRTTAVVAYDDAGGSIAARLWWMLHVLGRPAAILDGGLQAWMGLLSTGPVAPARAVDPGPSPHDWPLRAVASTDDVAAGTSVLLDARSAGRYAGDPGSPDAVAGHIPSALSAPWADNLDPQTGRLLPPSALRARYDALGATAGADVVASCGSGVTACLDLLALHLAGSSGRLYPGSWSAWSSDPSRPVSTGPS